MERKNYITELSDLLKDISIATVKTVTGKYQNGESTYYNESDGLETFLVAPIKQKESDTVLGFYEILTGEPIIKRKYYQDEYGLNCIDVPFNKEGELEVGDLIWIVDYYKDISALKSKISDKLVGKKLNSQIQSLRNRILGNHPDDGIQTESDEKLSITAIKNIVEYLQQSPETIKTRLQGINNQLHLPKNDGHISL